LNQPSETVVCSFSDHKGIIDRVGVGFPHGDYCLCQVVAGDGAWIFIDGYNRDCVASWDLTVPKWRACVLKLASGTSCAYVWGFVGCVTHETNREGDPCSIKVPAGPDVILVCVCCIRCYGVPVRCSGIPPKPTPPHFLERLERTSDPGRSFIRLAKKLAYRDERAKRFLVGAMHKSILATLF